MVSHSPYCACDDCIQSGSAIAAPIIKAVCSVFGVTQQELLGTDRSERFRRARSAALILLKERTSLSFSNICAAIGRMDHRTAMKGLARANQRREREPFFHEQVEATRAVLMGRVA